MSYSAMDKCGMMIYHLSVARLGPSEIRRISNKGYCNGYVTGVDTELGQTIMQARLAQEFGDMIWLYQGSFNSKKETLGEFMKKSEKGIKLLKEEGLWDTVAGFHWDEPLLHNPSNQDFLDMTRALYEEYGKRIYPVFSTYEITGHKGNADDPSSNIQFEKFASEFITDIGFDSYDYDVRPEFNDKQMGQIRKLQEKIPEIVDGQSYYRVYTQKLKDLMIGEPNIWFYPTAEYRWTWGQYFNGEDFCIAHLEFFLELLKEQKRPGGIHLYTWKSWSYKRPALDVLLDRDNPERWARYEETIQRVCKEVREMKLNPENRLK
ncbi:MAG: hypothetical protein IIW33_01570 [Oscillospiraceae bacterium]|nr:hypothetical protein [Oscillospiraceae bacterium]